MWRWELKYMICCIPMLPLYAQYIAVYRLKNHGGIWLSPIWLPLGLVFIICNIGFNLTFGSWLFSDVKPSRKWFFSDRIRAVTDDRKERFKRLLNAHDPGHIQ